MRVLMLGWEFPPVMNGGLGTACKSLCTGLRRQNIDITYVMPHNTDELDFSGVKFVGANDLMKQIKIRRIDSPLTGYMTSEAYDIVKTRTSPDKKNLYGKDLHEEVWRFGKVAGKIASEEEHDVIHAHDWMTYPAGISAKRASKKPLVVHIHNTAYDRTAGNPNKAEFDIEYHGFKEADRIIAISNLVKKSLITNYGVPEHKISVVHWGIDEDKPEYHLDYASPFADNKLVLFLGRITIQKGPDYFIEAARKVADHEENARFLVVGDGDMLPRMINRAAELGLSDKVFFTGALKGADVHKAFQAADVFVMPSVSEPFGLVALESQKNKTPVIISNTSGASEVLNHCLKVDFWDTDALANKILGVLRYSELQEELGRNGKIEADKLDLNGPALGTIKVYNEVLR